MATSALIGSAVCGGSLIFGATGDESGPGQAKGRWAVMEAALRGLRRPEPPLSPAAGAAGLAEAPTAAGFGLAWPAWRAAQMGLIGWRGPGTGRGIGLAMSDYSRAESDSVI